MGVHGLQNFIEKHLNVLRSIQLHDCNVLLDGNSLCHMIYSKWNLLCLFGGEYYSFYRYCIRLFESFAKCKINVLVVFDGAHLDDRKLSTILQRAQQRVKTSFTSSLSVQLSPLLLRQVFVSALDAMDIPYVSAIGEADDECVSLANHLDCYLIATDSDYYCYHLQRGYLPFAYVDERPMPKGSGFYLSARLYHDEALFRVFDGLKPTTLAFACGLCGNDYTKENVVGRILVYINRNLQQADRLSGGCTEKTNKLWNVMKWVRHMGSEEDALAHLLPAVEPARRNDFERQLRSAMQSYLNPSDTLIYRFRSLNNANLLRNPSLVERARNYLHHTLHMDDEQIRRRIVDDSGHVSSKRGHPLPLCLVNALSDHCLAPTFFEVAVQRRLICGPHIEVKSKLSIYTQAIKIVVPCLAILFKWDGEEDKGTVSIHQRVNDRLGETSTLVTVSNDDVPCLEQIQFMSVEQRQTRVRRCLKVPDDLLQQWMYMPSEYHFWLMIVRYWYMTCQPAQVYVWAVCVSLIRSVFFTKDHGLHPPFAADVHSSIREEILQEFQQISQAHIYKYPFDSTIVGKLQMASEVMVSRDTFEVAIVHELNCLQMVYKYSLQANEFFSKPYRVRVHPQHFICGTFFYGFVKQFKTAPHLFEAMIDLFRDQTTLLQFLRELFMCITSTDPDGL